jgi:uncharacterized protein (TIGR03067 family)
MTRCIVTVLVFGLPLAAAPAPTPKENDPKREAEKLQGAWRSVSVETGSEKTDTDKHVLTFDKSTFTFRWRKRILTAGTFTIDPSKKPKAIDLTITETSLAAYTGKVILGFYELEGDTLKWCYSDPTSGPAPGKGPRGRPQEFDPKEGSHTLFTFKREKPPAP